MTTVQAPTITREAAESTLPRTRKVGRMFASAQLGDVFVGKAGCEAPNNLSGLSKKDGLDLIHALAGALGVDVTITEHAPRGCPVCGLADSDLGHEGCTPRVVTVR